MAVRKSLPRTELWELRDHRDNTMDRYVKCYSLAQLSIMDGKDTRTIKNSPKYLAVRVDDSHNFYKWRTGVNKTPYRVLYIRMDEVKNLFQKKSGKKIVVEYN